MFGKGLFLGIQRHSCSFYSYNRRMLAVENVHGITHSCLPQPKVWCDWRNDGSLKNKFSQSLVDCSLRSRDYTKKKKMQELSGQEV